MPEESGNGFIEYKQLILTQLNDLKEICKETDKKLDKLREEVTVLKVKTSIYSAAIAFVVTTAITFLVK